MALIIHRRAAKCAETICFMLAVERTASIKDSPHTPNTVRSNAKLLPEGPEVLTFWRPCLGIALATAGQQKVKKRFLCDLCDLSEAGGEF